jgi:hypothetical protein
MSSNALINPVTGNAVGLLGDDIVVKYTYNGDANLDGIINIDDYVQIDSGYLAQPENPSYRDGDFNFDDVINIDDYVLIDTAYLVQAQAAATAPSPARSASPVLSETQRKARRRAPVRTPFAFELERRRGR